MHHSPSLTSLLPVYLTEKALSIQTMLKNVATGYHFTGPLALRLRLSADLLQLYFFIAIIPFFCQNVHGNVIIRNIYK